MTNKVLRKFIIGFLLINLEFMLYNSLDFFSIMPIVIIFHFIFLVIVANRWKTESTYSLYTLGLVLSYVYTLYANINALFYIIITIFLIWYTRTRIVDKNGTELFVKIMKMFIYIFAIRSLIFVIRYNINVDLNTLIIINTLASAVINGLITYLLLKIFQNSEETDEDHV